MTRKLSRNYSLGAVVLFIAVLTLLIAGGMLAQTSGAGQTAGKAKAVLFPGASAAAQAERSLAPWTNGAGPYPVSHSQAKRHGARPLDLIPPSFAPAVAYDSGGSGGALWGGTLIAVADANGDGKPDIVVANGGVGVLLGNGDGTFQPVVTYPSGGAISVAVADLRSDGKPDIVVATGGGVGVLLGNGDGTFQPVVTYGSGGDLAFSVAVADMNGDGKPDILVTNADLDSNTVAVLLGNGDGTFQPAVAYSSGDQQPVGVAVADVNGDGKPDLLVANMGYYDGSVSVLLGNGDGTFQPAVVYELPPEYSHPDSLAVADVNGDGKPDLLLADYMAATLWALLGNGDGTFQAAVTYPSGDGGAVQVRSVAVADVNGGGKPDLLVTTQCANANCDNEGTVGVLLGNGDGTFQPAVNFGPGGYGTSSVLGADVNADGKPDLLVVNSWSSTVGVLLNNVGAPPTTTTLVSSLNPARIKQSITYTAAVTAQDGGAVTGSVTFQDGGSTIATVPLANNQAPYTTTYKRGGSHAITATYTGDLHNAASTSATLMEYIEIFVSKTVVTTSGSPSHVGQAVTFTATVTSKRGAIPDGEVVTFYDGKTEIGTGTTANGVATFTTSSLKAKTHIIKGTYAGDDTLKPSTGSVKQVVEK